MLIELAGAGTCCLLTSLLGVGAAKTIAWGTAATLPCLTSAGPVATAASAAISAPSASALGGSAATLAAGAATIPSAVSWLAKVLGISLAAGGTAGASATAAKIAGGTKAAGLLGAATTTGGSGVPLMPGLPFVVPGPADVAGALGNPMSGSIVPGISKAIDARAVLPPTGREGLSLMCGAFFADQPGVVSRVGNDETVYEEAAECGEAQSEKTQEDSYDRNPCGALLVKQARWVCTSFFRLLSDL
uniref:Uncharacterized protein n=1 Tax=Neospora caninum (strain Liverpool) TaxID=572307 RepID=A0A0F7UHR1_NEOCL|nr:TPA: hypothetical protein BN1204_052460 [Neospora caninum Liverpool]